MTVEKIIEITNGELFSGDLKTKVVSFSKDTRTILKGDVYIGIKGENFDGNTFYNEALKKGASCVILEKHFESNLSKGDSTIVLVDDSIKALKDLATYKVKESGAIIIAITGSVGKTSTRDMIYSVLSRKYKTLVTEENYNNHIGLPLTVLRHTDEEVMILEMGMDDLGEIEYLSDIARPDIAVITNVMAVHIEKLKNIKNILKAKLEITSGLKEGGYLVFNNDNKYLREANLSKLNTVTCGVDHKSMYMAKDINLNNYSVNINNKEFKFDNPAITKPYITNGLLAIAVGKLLNVPISDIQKGLSEYSLTERRLEEKKAPNGALIIDDTYNANADSMINALEYLNKKGKGRRIAILGDINELGKYSKKLHKSVGTYIKDNPVDYLITIGVYGKYISKEARKTNNNVKHFNEKSDAWEFIRETIKEDDTVLVKASNGNKFAEIVAFLLENY